MTKRREDREKLREMLRAGLVGYPATFLCTLVSHMRGKLHMKTYQLYAGGCWMARKDEEMLEIPPGQVKKLTKMYGAFAKDYYNKSAFSSLQDQEQWLKRQLMKSYNVFLTEDMRRLTTRILTKDWEQEVERADENIARVAQVVVREE